MTYVGNICRTKTLHNELVAVLTRPEQPGDIKIRHIIVIWFDKCRRIARGDIDQPSLPQKSPTPHRPTLYEVFKRTRLHEAHDLNGGYADRCQWKTVLEGARQGLPLGATNAYIYPQNDDSKAFIVRTTSL